MLAFLHQLFKSPILDKRQDILWLMALKYELLSCYRCTMQMTAVNGRYELAGVITLTRHVGDMHEMDQYHAVVMKIEFCNNTLQVL